MHFPPRLPRWWALAPLSAAVVTATIACVAPAGASARSVVMMSLPTAKNVISATTKAIDAQASVRLTLTSTSTGKTKSTETVVEDEGKSNGLQTVTDGKAQVFVRFNKSDAYLSGNSKGLSTIFALSASDIKLVGSKWILVKSGTTQYTDIVGGGTIGPLAAEVLPTSTDKVTVANKTVSGQKANELTWGITSSGSKVHLVLDVAATGKSLPMKLTATSGSDTAVTLFSRWGETISITTPSSTIPISKITS